MTRIEQLLCEHEIAQLKYRYMRGIDTHDWALLATCFTEDAAFWPSKGNYVARGSGAIVELLKAIVHDGFVSSHIVVHPEIEMQGEDRARGMWRLEDMVFWTSANPAITHFAVTGGEELRGAGYYHDEYVRAADGWKVASCGYVRIFEDIRRPGEATGTLSVDRDRGMTSARD